MAVLKSFTTFLILIALASNVWAQQSCPLTNSKLSDLRTAASKLATNISLSASCKQYENTVNQANEELKQIATQIDATGTTTTNTSATESTALAMNALTQLNNIGSIFNNDKCGEELAGFLDYAEAFTDVAIGITPFLALYGGAEAMPWVLGTALGGAAIKSLISFFKNKSVDMRNPDQSNALIKNSCSFYNLDLIKSSLDDLELRQSPKLQVELEQARENLKRIERLEPKKPDTDLAQRLRLAELDTERVAYLQGQFKLDPVEACSYIEAYASKQDSSSGSSLIERVWENYEVTLKKFPFRMDLEKKYFFDDLNASAQTMDQGLCKDLGLRWLNKIANLSEVGITQLRKDVSQDSSVQIYETWLAEKKKTEDSVKVLEAKMKFFEELTSSGFSIEYSEIIRSHKQVQDTLFESQRYLVLLKAKGLAHAWLKVKQEDAYIEFKNFETRKKEVNERIAKIEKIIGVNSLHATAVQNFALNYQARNQREHSEVHKNALIDVCNQLRLTWNAWYNGLIHARAGRDYCVTFDQVINKLDYPEVQKLCFGTSSKIGHKLSSLKNQVKDFEAIKPQADEIIAEMRSLSCEGKSEMSEKIMALPIN